MTIAKINDHIEQAKERLITQYKQATNLKNILDCFNEQTQDLEDAIHELFEGRWVDVAQGQVLDDFGTIVGQDRLGFDDDFYRILIYVKMGQNISQGETERVIDVYKIITRATIAQIQEHFPAGVTLLSNGTINPITASFIYEELQKVVGAGIRVDRIGEFSDTPFGFAGAPTALGFGTVADSSIGGTFAFWYDTAPRFGFEDPNRNDILGFGTLQDHIYGGKFSTNLI
jgi:hypothetical protein